MTLNINDKENTPRRELLGNVQKFGAATRKFQESDNQEIIEVVQDIFLEHIHVLCLNHIKFYL